DIAQETFLSAFRALPHWRLPERASNAARPLSPWLYRIATNHALSLLRTRGLRGGVQVDTARDSTAGDSGREPVEAGFEERYAARELLRAALSQLTTEDAACLILHFVAGERYAEIASRLELTPEAVRKRIARGMVTLRAAYAALDTEVHASTTPS